MKLKKVDIQAFRAYDKPGEGSFDFHVGDTNDVANFISIYAPNGFGKTSFYDAVEYCVTNTVSRFTKTDINKDTAKQAKTISKNKKQLILRNRFSNDEVPSEVRILTTLSDKAMVRKVKRPVKNATADFLFDKQPIERSYFQTVILSQEWIDAFLRIDEPEERYKKFIQFFGDQKLDEYYRKLSEFINHTKSTLKDLKKSLKSLKRQIDFNGDKDLLMKVNDQIETLNKLGEALQKVDSKYGEKETIDLKSLIAKKISDHNFRVLKNKEHLQDTGIAMSGGENIPSLQAYLDALAEIRLIEEAIQKLEKNSVDYRAQEKNLNTRDKLITEKKNLEQQREEMQSIFSAFDSFEDVQKKLATESKNKDKLSQQKKETDVKIAALRKDINDEAAKIIGFTKLLEEVKQKLSELPIVIAAINRSQLSIDEILKTNEQLSKDAQTSAGIIGELERQLEDWKNFKEDLRTGEWGLSYVQAEKYKEDLQTLYMTRYSLERENLRLTNINNDISRHREFSTQMEEFVTKGIEIIRANESDTCPLCRTDFKNFKELYDRISSNDFLSLRLSELFNEQNKTSAVIADLNATIDKIKSKISDEIDQAIFDLTGTIEKERAKLTALEDSIERNNLMISMDRAAIDANRSKIIGRSEVDMTDIYNQEQATIVGKLKESQDKVFGLETRVADMENDLKQSIELVNASQLRLDLLRADKNYEKTMLYFSNKDAQADRASITKLIDKNRADLTVNDKKLSELNKLIDDLNAKLSGLVLSQNQEMLDSQKTIRTRLKSLADRYQQFLNGRFSVDVSRLTGEDIQARIKQAEGKVLSALTESQNLINEYQLLNELLLNVESYLTYAKAAEEYGRIKSRSELLEKKVLPELTTERTRVSNFLLEQVESFFYGKLINDLYVIAKT